MARKVRNAALESRAARGRLKRQPKPYFQALQQGLHLGYRRLGSNQDGTWVARFYTGAQAYDVERLGAADDVSDADGRDVLTFDQAQIAARARLTAREKARAAGAGEHVGPYTVRDAMTDYLGEEPNAADRNARRKFRDAKYKIDAFILPKLGNRELRALTTKELRDWHRGLANTQPRVRVAKGEKPKHRDNGEDREGPRRRRSTANRVLTILKAALNAAADDLKLETRPWRWVKAYRGADAARPDHFAEDELARLVAAAYKVLSVEGEASPAFGYVVEGGARTGARYGELIAMNVCDVSAKAGQLTFPDGKNGRRTIDVDPATLAFFVGLTKGRNDPDAPLFLRHDGERWGDSHQIRLMKAALKAAKLSATASFYSLRHTFISRQIERNQPLTWLAKHCGTSVRMIEKNYAHLLDKAAKSFANAAAMNLGATPSPRPTRYGNVVPMAAGRSG